VTSPLGKAPPLPDKPPPLAPNPFRRHSNTVYLLHNGNDHTKNQQLHQDNTPPLPLSESIYLTFSAYHPPLPSYPPPPIEPAPSIPSIFPPPPSVEPVENLFSRPLVKLIRPNNFPPPPLIDTPPPPPPTIKHMTFNSQNPSKIKFSPTNTSAPPLPLKPPPPIPIDFKTEQKVTIKRPSFLKDIEKFDPNNLTEVNKPEKSNLTTNHTDLPNELVKKINELRELLSK
jgi:hypothetical protein